MVCPTKRATISSWLNPLYGRLANIAVLLVYFFAATFTCLGQDTNVSSKTSQFKSYLESLPPVRQILFFYRSVEQTKDGAWQLPSHFRVAEGGWSENGFYLRSWTASNADVTAEICNTPPDTFLGRTGSNYWQIMGTNALYSQLTGNVQENKTNHVVHATHFAEFNLLRALCMGLGGIVPHTIHWTNDHFTALLDPRERPRSVHFKDPATGKIKEILDLDYISGDLESSPQSPLRLTFKRFAEDPSPTTITYKYSQTNALPMGLPDIAISTCPTPRGTVPLEELLIVSLKLAGDEGAPDFDPALLIGTNKLDIDIYTNGTRYARGLDGRLTKMLTIAELETLRIRGSKHQSVAYLVCFLLAVSTALFGFLCSRVKRGAINTKH